MNSMTVEGLSALIEGELQSLRWKQRPANLYQPIEYILSLGGKRMRPLLVLLGYSLFKNDPDKIVRPALAVEVFHNFTLMHDDIMDKAPLRRGKPTVHEKWNETVAILSGDTMMVKAYDLLMETEDKYLRRALLLFNTCAVEVCEGQQLDMDFETQTSVSVDEYLEMIRLKTAVLLGYSLQLGGLLAGANEPQQDQLRLLGIDLGMSFQLMDDHLDTFGGDAFGKQIGGDIRSNKKTFLLISALAKAKEENRSSLNRWLATSGQDEKKVAAVTNIFKEEGIDQLSRAKIMDYGRQAGQILHDLPGNEDVKKILLGYIRQLNERVI